MAAWHQGRQGSRTSNLLMRVSKHREPDVEQREATEERSLKVFIVLRKVQRRVNVPVVDLNWCNRPKKQVFLYFNKPEMTTASCIARRNIWGQSLPESTQHCSHRAEKN